MSSKGQPGRGGGGSPPAWIELFGHVVVLNAFALANGAGCTAPISVRNEPPRSVTLYTAEPRLQTVLETALATGHLISALGHAITADSVPGTSGVTGELIEIKEVVLYNNK